MYVIGKTGVGKSTLLLNLIAQDLSAGRGVVLLDPHGSLADEALALVPPKRAHEVLLFDPADESSALSFNLFRSSRRTARNRSLLVSQLIAVFQKHWSQFWGPRLEHILRNGLLAVAHHPAATMLLLYRFLSSESLRERVLGYCPDPLVRHFWQVEFQGYAKSFRAEALSPVLNKLGTLLASPIMRRLFSQERSRIDLEHLMNERGILIARLSAGQIGEDNAHLLGALLLSVLFLSATERARANPPVFVYADEFQHFTTGSIATILSEARKYGISLTLAHQYLAQLPDWLLASVLGNVGSKFLFRVGAEDASRLQVETLPEFNAEQLIATGRYSAVVRLLAKGRELRPFRANLFGAPTPLGGGKHLARIRQLSRERYTRPAAAVDQHLNRLLQSS
jgi:type IV secretory pathway TraG/TraD family ATPase VirD4